MVRCARYAMVLMCVACLAACDGDTETKVVIVVDTRTFPVAVETDVKYGEGELRTGGHLDLRMDIYTPVGDDVALRPALILVHGGAWASGDKADPQIAVQADFFASRGFVVFSLNYRLTGDDPAEAPQWWMDLVGPRLDEATSRAAYAATVDTATAVRFVRANAETIGVSPCHVFASGICAGAFNVLHVGLDDPSLFASSLEVNNPDESADLRLVIDHWGGTFRRVAIDPQDPPVLIVHGTADAIVPFVFAERLDESLTAAGVPHQFVALEGAGHSAWDATFEGKALNQIALEFIAMHGDVRLVSRDGAGEVPRAGFVASTGAIR